MFNLRKCLYTGVATSALLVLAPMINSSANSKRTTNTTATQPRTEKVAKPVFGQLKHNYTDWTLNGRDTMWNRPSNDGPRYQVINQNQLNYMTNHANTHEPNKYFFFLDYTATYKNHKRPDYFYVTSGSLHGWVFHRGLRQIGNNPEPSINVITNKADVDTPHANHITKSDRSFTKELSYSLTFDKMDRNSKYYQYDLQDAYWRASNLGIRNKRTRKALHKLVDKAVLQSRKMYMHTLSSKKYRKHLESLE